VSAHSRERDPGAHSSLKQLLSSAGPLPVAQAAELMLRVCEALAETHASGAIHGSLCPRKLAIATRDDGSLTLEVLDDPSSLAESMTDDDVWPYLAPEQLRGEVRVNARADLWAVGAVLHELLSGERPFTATTPAELAATIESHHATPVSKLRRDVPPGMDTLILYCLEKSPDGRPPSIGHVASALGRLVPAEARAAVARIHSVLRQQRPSDPRSDLAMVASGPAHDGSGLTAASSGGSIFASSSSVFAQRAKLGAAGLAFVVVCGLIGHSLRRDPPPANAAAGPSAAPVVAKPSGSVAPAESEEIQVLRADELPAMHVVDISALPEKRQRSAELTPAAAREPAAVPTEVAAADTTANAPEPTPSSVVPEAVELAEDDGATGGTDFNAAAAKSAIASAAARASACHDGASPPEKSVVTITFAPSGEASHVTATGALAGTPTGACVEQLFRGVSVPAFTGDSVTVSRTVSVGN
jgi:hypothetical protein